MRRTPVVLSIPLLFSLLIPMSASSQCIDYSGYLHWESLLKMQNAGQVLLSGNLLYVTRGNDGLFIVDVSNPDQPVIVGSVDTPGSALRVAVAGNYAYVADAYMGLTVIDISNPGVPVIVGNVPTNYAEDVAVAGSHAYIADYTSGLRVIDISNAASPAIVGTADTPGTTRSVAVSGNYAYIGDGYAAALRVIDVSNPANPVIAGSTATVDGVDQIVVIGNLLYAVSQSTPGFRIFSVSNPTSPVLMSSVPNFWASGVQIAGNLAYVTGTGGGGLHIFDISNPFNPVRVSSLGVPGNTASIALAGSHAYVTSTWGINVIAIPNSMGVPATSYVPTNYLSAIAVTGNLACVTQTQQSGLGLVDISNPPSATLIKSVATPEPCFGVELAGNFAYVAGYHNGLVRINVSNPPAAAIVDSVNAIEHAYDVALSGHYACVASGMDGVYVVDINTMSVVGSFSALYSNFQKIAAAGSYAYALTYSDLRVIDISDPAHPAAVGTWPTPAGYAPNVTVAGNYVYLAADTPYDITNVPNLEVLDISNPSTPIEVGSCETPGNAMAISVAGSFAYSADYDRGVQVIDIANPTNPKLVGGYNPARGSGDPGGLSGAVIAAGDYVYASMGPGMVIVPAQCQAPLPVLFTTIRATSGDGGVTVNWELTLDEALKGFEVFRSVDGGNTRLLNTALLAPTTRTFADRTTEPGKRYEYVVAAVLPNGDRIQSLPAAVRTQAMELTLFPNHPNPFNPQTTISFVLPAKMRVQLSVFDVQGRLVRTLIDREMTAGRKEINWDGRAQDGRSLASGVYFYRLDAGGRQLSGRMVLLK